MSSSTSNVPLSCGVIALLSIVCSAIVAALSGVCAVEHYTASGWFSVGLGITTIFYHLVVMVILQLRMRQQTNGSHTVEKGIVEAPAFNADKELYCTVSAMATLTILFACWVVAIGAFLYEAALRPGATPICKADAAAMILEGLLVGAQVVRAYVRRKAIKVTEQYETARKIRRFTTGELPRPLVLQRKYTQDSVSGTISSSAVTSEKVSPSVLMFSPPAVPDSALRPETRYNGAKSLVLADPKTESTINTSFHGSLSASSTGSFHTIASPTLH